MDRQGYTGNLLDFGHAIDDGLTLNDEIIDDEIIMDHVNPDGVQTVVDVAPVVPITDPNKPKENIAIRILKSPLTWVVIPLAGLTIAVFVYGKKTIKIKYKSRRKRRN